MGQRLPSSNNEQIVLQDSTKATYSASIADFLPVANATDFVELIGASSKLITLTNLRLSGSATAATYQGIYLYKRTTRDTTGTKTTTAIVLHDSSDPLPAAVVNQYSVNPGALGTGALLRADHLGLPAAAAGAVELIWDFGNRAAKAPKLLNANESFCLNFAAAAVPAGTNLHITLEWTEE